MWAVVPIKHLQFAKQRLAPVLSPVERIELSKAMLADVLDTLTQSPQIDGVTVVCGDRSIAATVERYRCEFLAESELGVSELSAVVTATTEQLADRGIHDVVIIHADLPLMSSSELEVLLRTHRNAGDMSVTIAADGHRSGSNCVAASPASRLSYHYGEHSLGKHLRSARKAGMKSTVLVLTDTALDIDTPADLLQLQNRLCERQETHTGRFLAERSRGIDRSQVVSAG